MGFGPIPTQWLTVGIVGGLTVIGSLGVVHFGRPRLTEFAMACHLGAMAAFLWMIAATVVERLSDRNLLNRETARRLAIGLTGVALAGGVVVAVLRVFEMVVVGLLRSGAITWEGRTCQTGWGGAVDLILVFGALLLSSSARRTVTPLFWMSIACVVWTSLMIPIPTRMGGGTSLWPGWMPWTLWAFLLGSMMVGGFVAAQEITEQFRRRRAWPDELELLAACPDPWGGFRPSVAAVLLPLMPLGAYHAGYLLNVPAAALLGVAANWLAHRLWNAFFAEVGMAFITLSVVSFVVWGVPDRAGGPDLATRMPLLLGAALIGLAMMAFLWHWLPNVWDQQLDKGRAWTTTGRMIPVARRLALTVAGFGTLAALQLALWPELSSTRDDTAPRWALGLIASFIWIGSLVLATRLSQKRRVAYVCLFNVAVLGIFVAVRMPDIRLKYWIVSHWPVVVALLAPLSLILSRLCRRGLWTPFQGAMEGAAVLTLPSLAILGVVVTAARPIVIFLGKAFQYDVGLLRTAAFGVLAVHYVLVTYTSGRRGFLIAAGICAAVSVAGVAKVTCGL